MTGPLPAGAGSLSALAAAIPGFDANHLPLSAARALLARLMPRPFASEPVALEAALGRILAADLTSPIDVPGHDNSAMDGYALRGSDLPPDNETVATTLTVAGTALAGPDPGRRPGPGQCLRIMTGAVLPDGFDTVVPQEKVTVEGDRIIIPAGAIRPGENRRRAGEDLARGRVAVAAGRMLEPADLGLLASLGLATVPLRPRLRVAFFSTGNEVRPVGAPLEAGCVYDSNRHTVRAMLARLGLEMIDLGIVRDDPAALADVVREAAGRADVILTTGGVGVGEADHTRAVYHDAGEALFCSLAIRPGRPFVIGRVRRAGQASPAILFGLPGNPVAAMVVFLVLVRDALLLRAGAEPQPLPLLDAVAGEPMPKRAGRTEFIRVKLTRGPDGLWRATPTGPQGSAILRSMSEADGLLVLEPGRGAVSAGERVDVLPLRGLI